MTLTDQQLIDNFNAVVCQYHLDNSGTITNYQTAIQQASLTYDASDFSTMEIDRWDFSTTEPTIATLKSTYTLTDPDLADMIDVLQDLNELTSKGTLNTSTDHLTKLTPNASVGDRAWDTDLTTLYMFNGTSWIAIT
jgi:uncharacterized membrane protein YdfJ with MMPL/SSD domain